MLKTASSIIGLVSIVSGIHINFTHRDRNCGFQVNILAGNMAAGENILLTSEKLDGKLWISLPSDDELAIEVWSNDGVLIYREIDACVDVEDRRRLKDVCVQILKGEFKFD